MREDSYLSHTLIDARWARVLSVQGDEDSEDAHGGCRSEFHPCRSTSSTSPASKLRTLGIQHEGKAPDCRRHPYLRRWLSLTRIGYEHADS